MNSKLLILAFSALAASSCQTDSPSNPDPGPDSSPVRINASYGEFIDAKSSPVSKAGAFKENDVITVSAGSQPAVSYTLTGAGEWTPKSGASLKWESATMNFTAVYPSTASVSDFTLLPNQSKADIIGQADYMTFSQSCTQSGDSPVSINLIRKTARVIVSIDKFEDPYTSDSKVSDVEIFSPKAGYKGSSVDGGVTKITPLASGDGSAKSTYTALVIPTGSVTASTPFIGLTAPDGVKLTLLKSEIPAFTAGYSYTYSLTIKRDKVVINSVMIEKWTDNTIPDGTADLNDLKLVEYVKIEKDDFWMGSSIGELDRADEEFQHKVKLSQDFYMSKYEITNYQYCLFLNACNIGYDGKWKLGGNVIYNDKILIWDCKNPSVDQHNGVTWDDNKRKWVPANYGGTDYECYPVINVTWFGAKAFAEWVGGDLPTEAQWEYACRAGTETPWVSGTTDSDLEDYAWYSKNSEKQTSAVGITKKCNRWGLYDMHGNVCEWCNDWYEKEYYKTEEAKTDPKGPANPENPSSKGYRVVRGGYWGSSAPSCRSACRNKCSPDYNSISSFIGFRVVVPCLF